MKYIIFATVLNSHKMESKEYFEKGHAGPQPEPKGT